MPRSRPARRLGAAVATAAALLAALLFLATAAPAAAVGVTVQQQSLLSAEQQAAEDAALLTFADVDPFAEERIARASLLEAHAEAEALAEQTTVQADASFVEVDLSASGTGPSGYSAIDSLPMTSLNVYNNFRELNMQLHNANKYRAANGARPANALVLRRNQPFVLQLPGITKGTRFELFDTKGRSFALTVVHNSQGRVVLTSTNGPIGRYQLRVRASAGGSVLYTAPDTFYFTFNAWAASDPVFVSAADKQKYPRTSAMNVDVAEHLQNEFGVQYQGTSSSYRYVPWSYAQFDMAVIDTVFDFAQAQLSLAQLADVVKVSRFLTAISPSILTGRWDGNYAGATNPSSWRGSLAVINQYRSTRRSVQYGQCWVFAGLLTSMLRSIGVPCRSMTNMDSVHLNIGRLADRKTRKNVCYHSFEQRTAGGAYSYNSGDSDHSTWSFHVWVDAWFRRADIAGGAGDGWQALDGTPQERSFDGPAEAPFTSYSTMVGPVPLARLHALDFNSKYDALFVSASSNCIVYNRLKARGASSYTVQQNSKDVTKVGRFMLTKMPDSLCTKETTNQWGYATVCTVNTARAYSVANTFLEVGAGAGAGAGAADMTSEIDVTAASVSSLPVRAILYAQHDPRDPTQYLWGDNIAVVMVPATAGALTGTYRWSIQIFATAGGELTTEVKSARGVWDGAAAAAGKPAGGNMGFVWDKNVWMDPVFTAAFQATHTYKALFQLEPVAPVGAEEGAVFLAEQSFFINPPAVDVECEGESMEKIQGDTLVCTATVADKHGLLSLSGVTVSIEVTGQNSDATPKPLSFPAPAPAIADDGKTRIYTFPGLAAKLTTVSSRWMGVIVTVQSAGMPTMSGNELVLVSAKPGTVTVLVNTTAAESEDGQQQQGTVEAVTTTKGGETVPVPVPGKGQQEQQVPSKGQQEQTPSKGQQEQVPSKGQQEQTSSKGQQEQTPSKTPSKGQQEQTPSKTPSKGQQEQVPAKGQQEETPSKTPSKGQQEQTPSKTPSKGQQEQTPSKGQQEQTPSKTPSKGQQEQVPSKGQQEQTPSKPPSKGQQEQTPSKGQQEQVPSKGQQEQTPSKTPSQGQQEQVPAKGQQEETPSKGQQSVTVKATTAAKGTPGRTVIVKTPAAKTPRPGVGVKARKAYTLRKASGAQEGDDVTASSHQVGAVTSTVIASTARSGTVTTTTTYIATDTKKQEAI